MNSFRISTTVDFDRMASNLEFTELLGKTVVAIEKGYDQLIFSISDGSKYKLYHHKNMCENIYIEDIAGDIDDLLNTPITLAEKATNRKDFFGNKELEKAVTEWEETFTWTFYKLATIKGYVTIRWLGQSNGYYAEEVCFRKTLSAEGAAVRAELEAERLKTF